MTGARNASRRDALLVISSIDIAMTPAEALLLPAADCYVVIDALRATTTMAALFHAGLERLTVVSTLEAGRAARKDPRTLLLGESGGLPPPGFDYGNSPAEFAALDFTGREAIQVTSNGTVAICAVAHRAVTVAGALVNLSAVAAFAANHARIVLVCAGNGGARVFSLEDFAVAAAFVVELCRHSPGAILGDGAVLALSATAAESLIRRAQHADVLRALGLAADVEFVVGRDTAPAVPVVTSFGEGWAVLENQG